MNASFQSVTGIFLEMYPDLGQAEQPIDFQENRPNFGPLEAEKLQKSGQIEVSDR